MGCVLSEEKKELGASFRNAGTKIKWGFRFKKTKRMKSELSANTQQTTESDSQQTTYSDGSQQTVAPAKILLLGGGESGKSTFLKQLRILLKSGYTTDERIECIHAIQCNALHSLVTILTALKRFQIDFDHPDEHDDAKWFLGTVEDGCTPITVEMAKVMKSLWKSDAVQKCYKLYADQISDSAQHFLDDVERLATDWYIPTIEDVLRMRIKTTGFREEHFSARGMNFSVVDLGGQRSERRKWVSCFEMTDAVIFFAALSEYDQMLREDATVSRMHDSLKVFKSVCDNYFFRYAHIVLFLTKRDIFVKKIKTVPLTVCFPEYKGENNYEEASQYILSRFEEMNQRPGLKISSHFVCITDTTEINFVMMQMSDIIAEVNLRDCSLL